MRYKIYDDKGNCEANGILDKFGDEFETVPCHGSIHLEIAPELWLNIRTSEIISGEVVHEIWTWPVIDNRILNGKYSVKD